MYDVLHRRRLFKMTAGARFESLSGRVAKGVGYGEGVSPSPSGVGSGEGAVSPPQKIFWLKLMHSVEILTLF